MRMEEEQGGEGERVEPHLLFFLFVLSSSWHSTPRPRPNQFELTNLIAMNMKFGTHQLIVQSFRQLFARQNDDIANCTMKKQHVFDDNCVYRSMHAADVEKMLLSDESDYISNYRTATCVQILFICVFVFFSLFDRRQNLLIVDRLDKRLAY